MKRHTFSVVPSRLYSTGLSCTAAARTFFGWLITPPFSGSVLPRHVRSSAPAARLHRPGVDDDGVVPLVEQDDVEHVERVDRTDAFDQRALAVAVERLEREAARVDLAAFAHELLDLSVEVQMAGKRFVA